jgi:uncharacterized protein HemX
LALMRNDVESWDRSLQRVEDTLNQFFSNDAAGVQALLLYTTGLKQVDIAPQMPDISAPWTQLRQLRDSRRLLQSSTPVEVKPAEAKKAETQPVEEEQVEGEGSDQ